jgi:hypothetical protein
MMSLRNLSVACAVVLVAGGQARAADRSSSVDRLVQQIMSPAKRAITKLLPDGGSVGIAIRFHLPSSMNGASKLQELITQLVSGKLSGSRRIGQESIMALPDSRTAHLEEAAERGGHDFLLMLDFSVQGGHARLAGGLLRVRANFWTRVKEPVGGIRHFFYGQVRIDASFRMLMSLKARELTPSLRPGPEAPKGALAVASGDLDGDGLEELVWLTDSELRIEKWRGNEGHYVSSTRLDELGINPTRLRRPWGTLFTADVTNDGTHEIALWSSQFLSGWVYRLGTTGQPEPVMAPDVIDVCGHSVPGRAWRLCGPVFGVRYAESLDVGDVLLVGQVDRDRGTVKPSVRNVTKEAEGPPVRLDGLALTLASGAWPKTTPGEYTDILGTVDRRGRMRITAEGSSVRIDGVGAQVGFADLNDDGVVEIVRSSDVAVGEADELVIHEFLNTSAPERFRANVPSIRYLSVGDADNDGIIDVLILSENGEVHLLDSRGGT